MHIIKNTPDTSAHHCAGYVTERLSSFFFETAEVTALHWPGFHFGPQDGRAIFDMLSDTALSLPGTTPAPKFEKDYLLVKE